MYDGFITQEHKEFSLKDLSTHIGSLLNNRITYTYKPIKKDKNIIEPMSKDYNYNRRRIKAKYYARKLKQNQIDLYDLSDGTYSDIINLFYGDNCIFQNEDIYIYHDKRWIENNHHLIKSFIEEKLKDFE